MRRNDSMTVSRAELLLLRLAAVVSTSLALVLLVLLLQLGDRVRAAEASERTVTDRLVLIYERVRRVQLIMEKRAEAQGLELPPEVNKPGPLPGGR